MGKENDEMEKENDDEMSVWLALEVQATNAIVVRGMLGHSEFQSGLDCLGLSNQPYSDYVKVRFGTGSDSDCG